MYRLTQRKRKPYQRHQRSVIEAAVQWIQENEGSENAAAIKFGIPRSTIKYYLTNPTFLKNPRKKGSATMLTEEEEQSLNDWILEIGKKGYCPR
jgi:hypothetical protein